MTTREKIVRFGVLRPINLIDAQIDASGARSSHFTRRSSKSAIQRFLFVVSAGENLILDEQEQWSVVGLNLDGLLKSPTIPRSHGSSRSITNPGTTIPSCCSSRRSSREADFLSEKRRQASLGLEDGLKLTQGV